MTKRIEPASPAKRHALSLAGCTGLYVEKTRIWSVTIDQVRDLGSTFEATARSLPVDGLLTHEGPRVFGAPWDGSTFPDLRIGRYRLSTSEWQFHFESGVVARLAVLLAGLPPGRTYMDDWPVEASPTRSRFVRRLPPGLVAQRVLDFLGELHDPPVDQAGVTAPTCLRCLSPSLDRLSDSDERITFYRCPTCGRDYAQGSQGVLTFRWRHPISLVLYAFDSNAALDPGSVKRTAAALAHDRTALEIHAFCQEIELELQQPTQPVSAILETDATEATCRTFLNSVVDQMRRSSTDPSLPS
ncbi:hypothetical protein BH10PSE17_BH10PSE17_09460 [soil metagenome]